MAHRLEVAVLDVMKQNIHVNLVQDILFKFYRHYQYSPKALSEMRELAESLNINSQKPVRCTQYTVDTTYDKCSIHSCQMFWSFSCIWKTFLVQNTKQPQK